MVKKVQLRIKKASNDEKEKGVFRQTPELWGPGVLKILAHRLPEIHKSLPTRCLKRANTQETS